MSLRPVYVGPTVDRLEREEMQAVAVVEVGKYRLAWCRSIGSRP